ncbi:MAG: alpha/beta fold hydrolase [Pseudonocardiaceae bacterium]
MPYATINGIELCYEDNGAGVPVVFLHCWGTSGRVWGAQVTDLARDHRVITVDWRGCGRSGHPATGNSIAGNAADILALLDVLGLERPVLVGSSIGATFAIAAALAAPERIGGVVSIDGPGYWPAEGMAERLRELRVALLADRAGTLAGWVPNWYGPAVGPAMHEWTIRQILDSGVFIDELFTDAATFDLRESIGGLAVPVTFLHGRLDAEIPLEVSQTLAALAPRGVAHIIEGAGHMPHQEQPAAVNAALRAALS